MINERIQYLNSMCNMFHEGTADDQQIAATGRYYFYHLSETPWGLEANAETLPADRIEDFVKACCAYCWWEGDFFGSTKQLYAYMKDNLPSDRWSVYEKFLDGGKNCLCFFPEYQRAVPLEGPFER